MRINNILRPAALLAAALFLAAWSRGFPVAPVITAPDWAVVTSGSATTVANISLSETGQPQGSTQTITLVDTSGVLTATGGTVSGSGTTSMTIGPDTMANINTALATLQVNTSLADTLTLNAHDSHSNNATQQTVAIGFTVPSYIQTQANAGTALSLIQSFGFNTHLQSSPYTAAGVMQSLAFLGVNRIRDFNSYSGNVSNYNILTPANVQYDWDAAAWNNCGSGQTPQQYFAPSTLDSYASNVLTWEGLNEINNQPPCWENSAAATSGSGTTLNFTATLAALRAVTVISGAGAGVSVNDVTHPAAIPGGTTIASTTATTVVLSASATITNGDTIHFEANGTNPAAGIAWQQDKYNSVKGDTHFASTPVLNFTDSPNYGVSGSADLNNQHIYPTGGAQPVFWFQPSSAVNTLLSNITTPNGISGLALHVTETGYYTLIDGAGGVDLPTQAVEDIWLVLDAYYAGTSGSGWGYSIPQIYFYEMQDEVCGGGSSFTNFGLFDCNNVPKPIATALHNLTTILHDTSGSFTPSTLSYSITGLPVQTAFQTQGGGYTFQVQKSNGHYFVPIWNEAQIWTFNARSSNVVNPVAISVSFGTTPSSVKVYDPLKSTDPIQILYKSNPVGLALGADALILEVIP